MSKKVQITCSVEQAAVLAKALDFYTRMGIGQLTELTELVRDGAIPIQQDSNAPRATASVEVIEAFEDVMHSAKSLLGYRRNASNGIGHDHVAKQFHRSYEMMKVVEKALAYDRNPNPEFKGVNYDGLICRYTTDEEPTAVVTTK